MRVLVRPASVKTVKRILPNTIESVEAQLKLLMIELRCLQESVRELTAMVQKKQKGTQRGLKWKVTHWKGRAKRANKMLKATIRSH